MKPLLLSLALLFITPAMMDAQFLNTYQWKSRLVLLFTPSPDNTLFLQQMSLLAEQSEAFEERDVLFITITPNGEHENTGRFPDESLARQYYQHFNPPKTQFELIVVGLDSGEKLRVSNRLTSPTVILELIDGMPMRRQQMRQADGKKGKE